MGVIRPGPLTQGGAAALNDFARRTEANAAALGRLRRKSPRTILARVTDFDAATNAYTWHERAIAADGTRYDKPAGRSGSPAYAPAYGIGTGSDSLLTIPADVTMRLATVTTTLGPVYEIDTVCKCERGTSGSVGVVPCCPDKVLPATFDATFFIYDGLFPPFGPGQSLIDTVNVTLVFGVNNTGVNLETGWWGDPLLWGATFELAGCSPPLTIDYTFYAMSDFFGEFGLPPQSCGLKGQVRITGCGSFPLLTGSYPQQFGTSTSEETCFYGEPIVYNQPVANPICFLNGGTANCFSMTVTVTEP